MTNNNMNDSQAAPASQPEMAIQRLYVKDLSVETPNSPHIFKQAWKPELKLEVQTGNQLVEPNIYEVTLTLTATVNCQENVAFLIELKYAGIFTFMHFNEQQLGFALGSVAPAIIFPYAREVISDISVRAGFPPLILAPMNFDAIYNQQLAAKAANSNKDKGSAEETIVH
jgi:preprotein translocase subunit SecB